MVNYDMERFLSRVEGWNNHLPLLWLALQQTKLAVVEYGSGEGSTPYLREYCLNFDREFISYDYNKEWADKMNSIYISDWDSINPSGSLILLDHSPGERREKDIIKLAANFEILVCHDTEPETDNGYQMRQHFVKFKYVCELKTNGAWASALSNSIDVTKWSGIKIAGYELS